MNFDKNKFKFIMILDINCLLIIINYFYIKIIFLNIIKSIFIIYLYMN